MVKRPSIKPLAPDPAREREKENKRKSEKTGTGLTPQEKVKPTRPGQPRSM